MNSDRDFDTAEHQDVMSAIGAVIFGDTDITAPLSTAAHLAFIHRADTAIDTSRKLLQQSVDAGRAAGLSWAAIGEELSMTRQAAHQRFGQTPMMSTSGDERWLGPVTAFDEMRELELAGRLGWHTIGAGWLQHRMVRTETQWEHLRLLWPASARSLLRAGWHVGVRAFPWVYLIRDTGLPAETEPLAR